MVHFIKRDQYLLVSFPVTHAFDPVVYLHLGLYPGLCPGKILYVGKYFNQHIMQQLAQ